MITIEILMSVKKHGTSTPLYGESPRCRAGLYQVLLQLCLEPCTRWPPPTQFALQLLRYGQDDCSPQVSSTCSAALTMIDRIIHPEFSLAAFPIDYKEIMKEMTRFEEDVQIEPEQLSIIIEDSQESVSTVEENQTQSDSPNEVNGLIEIVEVDEQPVQETIVISEIPVNGDCLTENNSQESTISNKTVEISSSGDEKRTSRKRNVHSSESDSTGTPPKRQGSEHTYNLRPKTPKSAVDSPVIHSSKTRRVEVDLSSPKGSLKGSDSNDTDDLTILFDETIIN